jgi:hypothetical protein
MLKWLLALAVTVAVAAVFMPRLTGWLRLARLPGDVRLRLRGRDYYLPFASTVLLSLLFTLLLRWL